MAEIGMGLSDELVGDEEEVEEEGSGLPPDFQEPDEDTEEDLIPDDEAGDSDEEETDEDEEEQQEAAPQEDKPSRAQKRIQDLVSSNKELQQNLDRQQQYFQHQLAEAQKQQRGQQEQFQKEQIELQRQQLELARSRQAKEEDANLTELDKFERRILEKAKSGGGPEVEQELADIKRQLQESKAAQEKAKEETERQQRVQHFSRQADTMLGDVVLKGIDTDAKSDLDVRTKDVLMTYCAAYGVEPKAAAPKFRQFLDDYAQAVMQGRAQSGKRATKIAGAPNSKMSPKSKKEVPKTKWPSLKALQANNYDTHIEWLAQGSPPLESAD